MTENNKTLNKERLQPIKNFVIKLFLKSSTKAFPYIHMYNNLFFRFYKYVSAIQTIKLL